MLSTPEIVARLESMRVTVRKFQPDYNEVDKMLKDIIEEALGHYE